MTFERAESEPFKAPKKWALRLALLVLGLALVAWLVADIGSRLVAGALWYAAPWIPLLFALEVVILGTDTVAFASILGIRDSRVVPAGPWIRSTAWAFLCLTVLPAGRVACEVARAAVFARYLGATRAARSGAVLQAAALMADGIISAFVAGVLLVVFRKIDALSGFLFVNTLVALAGGSAIYLAFKSPKIADWLGKRLPSVVPDEKLVRASDGPVRLPFSALAWSVAGRFVQVFQYGVAVRAVGGALSFMGSVVSHGVHMVGATVGTAVPGQVGVADSAYVAFASSLGFASSPERALSISLVLRAAQVALVVVCLLALFVTKSGANAVTAAHPRDAEGAPS
ncbi:MAG: lysylphosphatidylglycerol synthase domain-containing protein [Polyangiaceae bacterium]